MEYSLFEASPGVGVALLPDAPRFTILAVSDDFVHTSGRQRAEVVGKGLFEVFPENPDDPDFTGEPNLRASFMQVLEQKQPHKISIQRYDIPTGEGAFTEKYWRAHNLPVLNGEGDVVYLIHRAEDITEQVKIQQKDDNLKSIQRAYHLFMQAPVAVCIVQGPEYRVELVNEQMQILLGRTSDILGKRIDESLTEAKVQGLMAVLDHVRITGESYYSPSFGAELLIDGVRDQRYFDLVFKPYFQNDEDKVPDRIFCVAYNVTNQIRTKKRLEELQAETERQKRVYETITANTPDLIYVFGLDYRFTYANAALLTMWGLTWEEAIGKGLLEIGYEPWHAEMHEREIDQIVATKQPVRGEVSFPHATLGKRLYDYILVPVLNEKGEVEAVAGTTRDITDIKAAEQSIRESEERFRKMADESPMFVFIIDPEPGAPVQYWNKTWLKYTGQTMEEAKGRAWAGIIHPDDVPTVMEQYTPAFESRTAYFIPAIRVRRHDGVYRWHAFKGNPRYTTDGHFTGYVGVGFDIHEQKTQAEMLEQRVEERTKELASRNHLLDNILKNSSNGISVSQVFRNKEGKVVDAITIMANDAAVNYIGLPRDIYLSKKATEIEPDIIGSPYYQACIRTLETGDPFLMQYQMQANGRWLELTVSRLDRDNLIHIFTDITAVKEAQLQLERSVEELKRSNASLEDFAYAASHDMKEPIRKVLVFSDRLKASLYGKLEPEETRLFERMQSSGKRMAGLIDDLLEYSHVQKGSLETEWIDLNEKVQLVLEDLELEIELRGAKITIEPLPAIEANRRQVQQLFQNLVGNALKYSKPGVPPRIEIKARTEKGTNLPFAPRPGDADKLFHLLSVQDNGIGFEQKHAERIFKMFTRLQTAEEYRGTGVGLSIVQKIVENHKGYIWAESVPGEGSKFWIALPEESGVNSQ